MAGKTGRPVKNTREKMVVGYGLSLFQLLDLDEKNQVLTTNVWAKYTWIDQLLRWDPSNYSNIREVRIPPELIWTPDIVLYNYADERLKEKRDVMLNVDYLGRVFWSPPAIFKSNCRIDIRNFPFDYQYCFLKFASWTQNSDELDLQFLDNLTEVDVDQYTSSNEWTLVARPAYRFVMMSEECGKSIPDLTFFLFLKRNPAFYAYLLVFPCVLLSLLTTVTFWLPPHVPAKMLLGMNIFVAFSVLLKLLANSTPSASITIPYLGYFYCVNLTLLSLSTFISTVVINVHSYGPKRGPVPPFLAKMVKLFATPLSITKPEEDEDTVTNLELEFSKEIASESAAQSEHDRLMAGYGNPMVTNMLQQFQKSGFPNRATEEMYRNMMSDSVIASQYPPWQWTPETLKRFTAHVNDRIKSSSEWSQRTTPEMLLDAPVVKRRGLKSGPGNLNGSCAADPCNSLPYSLNSLKTRRTTIQIHTSLNDLREALKNLMVKVTKKDAMAKTAREWRMVVMTIDRIFFWFSLVTIVASGCYLLFPRGQTQSVQEVLAMHEAEYEKRNIEVAKQCLMPRQQI